MTIQIQTKHVEDLIGKENTIISLEDWKIIMFDDEGVKIVKWFEVFQSFFHMSILKIGHQKNMTVNELTYTL